jgi:hypothetical protein
MGKCGGRIVFIIIVNMRYEKLTFNMNGIH